MTMSKVMLFQWAVWIIGTSVFAIAIGLMVRAIVRASRRPPQLHSAAEQLQRSSPLPAAADARIRELSGLKERGVIGDAEFERQRRQLLRPH